MSIFVKLSLQNRHVYIIGGGQVAYRKYQAYRKEGAKVCVIAPSLHKDFLLHPDSEYIQDDFSWDYISADAFLMYAATNDILLQKNIVIEAKKRNILCGCANQGMGCDIQSMAVWEGEALQVALSTNGKCPAADRVFLDQLDEQLSVFDKRMEALAMLRNIVYATYLDNEKAKHILQTSAMLSSAYLDEILFALKGKQVLLLAYHGIANGKQFQPILTQIEQTVKQQHSNVAVLSVFLSEKIVKKAKCKGYDIEHIETITRLLDDLTIHYQIQPVLLHEGTYYQELKKRYATQSIGEVLCASLQDRERIQKALQEQYPKAAILCLSHASDALRHTNGSNPMDFLYKVFDEPLAYPNHCMQLHVIPYCILSGYHVEKDIQGRWLPYLSAHISKVEFHNQGLLTYPFCRNLLYEKINVLIQAVDVDNNV